MLAISWKCALICQYPLLRPSSAREGCTINSCWKCTGQYGSRRWRVWITAQAMHPRAVRYKSYVARSECSVTRLQAHTYYCERHCHNRTGGIVLAWYWRWQTVAFIWNWTQIAEHFNSWQRCRASDGYAWNTFFSSHRCHRELCHFIVFDVSNSDECQPNVPADIRSIVSHFRVSLADKISLGRAR